MLTKILILFSMLFSIEAFAIHAEIKNFKGDVLVNGRPVRLGQKLKAKMIVEAKGKKSFVQVNFDNGDIAKVRNGSVVIQELTDKKSRFKILRGLFFAHVEKKNNRNIEVVTSHTTMGVRGTKFLVQEKEKETYLCVCEGAVELSNDKGDILVTKGKDIHASKVSTLEVIEATDSMWEMATMEFKDMGLEIGPRK